MEKLPKDVLRYIMLGFDLTPMDVSRLARVSKRLYDVARLDQVLWSRLSERYFGKEPASLLLPAVAETNLPQRGLRFKNSERERTLQAAVRVVGREPDGGMQSFADFLKTLAVYRLEVWPTHVFYLGVTEVMFADCTNGTLCDFFRAQCQYDDGGAPTTAAGIPRGGVSPAGVTTGKSVYQSSGDCAFNVGAFPVLMNHLMMYKDRGRKGGLCVVVEPPCGYAQARPAIAKAIKQDIGGNPFFGTVDMTRVLTLGLRATLSDWNALPYPFLMTCFEGPECWSGVIGEGGIVVKGTYCGFNPRVRKKRPDPHVAMRKNLAMRLMKAETQQNDDDDGELRIETAEWVAAKHVCQASSVYDTMFQGEKHTLLRRGIVLVTGGAAATASGFDETQFVARCMQLSGAGGGVRVLHHERTILSVLLAKGVCVLATNFEWSPVAL